MSKYIPAMILAMIAIIINVTIVNRYPKGKLSNDTTKLLRWLANGILAAAIIITLFGQFLGFNG